MMRLRRYALDDMDSRKYVKLPDMKAPKLTNINFEDWNTAFSSVVGRQYSLADVTLDYLLRDKDVGYYNFVCRSRDEKIKNCISLNGTRYRHDKEGYIHWLSSTFLLMAVAQIFLLRINVPRMEGKFTLSYAHTFKMIPAIKTYPQQPIKT